jgi:osmotically-inducible protein OsmY
MKRTRGLLALTGAAIVSAALAVATVGEDKADDPFVDQFVRMNELLARHGVESPSIHCEGESVTIRGTVKSRACKKAVTLEIAKLPGILSVVNQLECKPPAEHRATEFRTVIAGALQIPPVMWDVTLRQAMSGEGEDDFCCVITDSTENCSTMIVYLDVHGGHVEVAGRVADDKQRLAIVNAIISVAGDHKVVDRLRIIKALETQPDGSPNS